MPDEPIKLLRDLCQAEIEEINDSAKYIATIRHPLARLVYQNAIIRDATRHLEVFSMLLDWVEKGKPKFGKVDIPAQDLAKGAATEFEVARKVTQLVKLLDDPDARALLDLVIEDERQHEKIIKYLRSRT